MPDNTKYRFDNQEYGKGRLVLACISSMVSGNEITFGSLKEQLASVPFNGDVIIDKASYENKLESSPDTERRYFINDPLTAADEAVFYVSNQWGVGNIDGFIDKARELGKEIDIIPDQASELIRLFNQYQQEPRSSWIDTYRERCELVKNVDVDTFDFSGDKFLENYWQSGANGISSVMPGSLSVAEFDRLKDTLPEISKTIASEASATTFDAAVTWAKQAKADGLFTSIKHGVINRVFCAFYPDTLSTVLNYNHLYKFATAWNAKKYGQKVDLSGNWFELNARLMKAIKMRGLEGVDPYVINTFVYKLKEYLVDDGPEPGRSEQTKPEPIIDSTPIRESVSSSSALNQILYGPPGTGKTFDTIEKAVEIADLPLYKEISASSDTTTEQREKIKVRFDELLKSGQVAFTTFHQNYSYEDFMEGLKAESESGQIAYTIEDGIFKQICDRADPHRHSGGLEEAIADLKEKCSEDVITLNTATGKAFALSYRDGRTFRCMPEASTADRDLPANIDHVRKMVRDETPENLYCGSYVKAIAKYLRDNYSIEQEDAVAPLSAVPHVLIIDEINRGNIAKIFGELITLLEPGKRKGQAEELTAILPYSKEPFSVPANLHVIGTMNTADTSLAKVDIALRRRFEFIEMMPKISVLEDLLVEGVDIGKLLEVINQRIELLYDRDHTIGHSYFMGLSSGSSITDLAVIFEKQIIPLLEEYFFDDWSLIHRVLGDHLKGSGQPAFIIKKYSNNEMRQLMGPDWQADASLQTGWKLNRKALLSTSAYQGIYAPVSRSDTAGLELDTEELGG